jgi:hypothetical protein
LIIVCSFLQAPHSRERLNVTREMLAFVLSYHQVMPNFLDFIFSYGRRFHDEGSHYSGFKHESRLAAADKGLKVPQLGRSGRTIQLCYSLRSIEPSNANEWPWSIRQTAVYHSFDLESGQATWIVVKGNQLMKERLMSATDSPSIKDFSDFGTPQASFSSSVAMHLLFCDWSTENGQWYINFLEEKAQSIGRKTFVIPIPLPPDQTSATARSPRVIQNLSRILTFHRKRTSSQQIKLPPGSTFRALTIGSQAPPQPGIVPMEDNGDESHDGLSLDDMQRIQFIEEKADEVFLVFKTNINILAKLADYYSSIMHSEDWAPHLLQKCKSSLIRFGSRIESAQHELQMQQSRLEALLRLLANRKRLVCSFGLLCLPRDF